MVMILFGNRWFEKKLLKQLLINKNINQRIKW